MAGSARLIFGIVQLMLFTLGLVAASQLLHVPPELLANVRVQGLGWWAAPVWFNGPDDADSAVRSASATAGGGGASARW